MWREFYPFNNTCIVMVVFAVCSGVCTFFFEGNLRQTRVHFWFAGKLPIFRLYLKRYQRHNTTISTSSSEAILKWGELMRYPFYVCFVYKIIHIYRPGKLPQCLLLYTYKHNNRLKSLTKFDIKSDKCSLNI